MSDFHTVSYSQRYIHTSDFHSQLFTKVHTYVKLASQVEVRSYCLEDLYLILHFDIGIFFLQSIEWILALCDLPTNRRGSFLVVKEVTDHLHLVLRMLNLHIHLYVFSVAFVTSLIQCKLV